MDAFCNTNVLMLGKTGSGKSSLTNYLYGQDLVIGKAGAPVTVKGFHKQPAFEYKGLKITIYDSWGLEADKTSEWKNLLRQELEKTDSASISDWFHTVIYCFDTKASRLDQFEKEEIIDCLLNRGVRLIFALTKWDLCSDSEKTAAKDVLNKNYPDLDCIPICSVSKKLRNGTLTSKLGKEELFKYMCLNLRDNLVFKTISIAKAKLSSALNKAEDKVLDYYEDKTGPLGIFTYYGEDLMYEIEAMSQKIFKKETKNVAKYLSTNFSYINDICANVIESYTGKKINTDELKNIVNKEFKTSGLNSWDSSWEEDVATIVTTFLSGGIFQFLKKGMYRNKLKADLNSLSCSLKTKLERWVDSQMKTEFKIKQKYQLLLDK